MLCELLYPRVYRYVYYRVSNREDQEDITNDVLIKVIQSIPGQKGGSIHGWVYKIASNLVTDYYRRRGVRETVELVEDPNVIVGDDEKTVEQPLMHAALREAMTHLTEDQREVITLKFIQGHETGEIAEMLGKSVEAIRALQFRGLVSLRKLLGK